MVSLESMCVIMDLKHGCLTLRTNESHWVWERRQKLHPSHVQCYDHHSKQCDCWLGLCLDVRAAVGHVIIGDDALPQPIGLSDGGLPEPQRPVFAPAGVQLSIRWESHAVHWSKVALERLCTQKGHVGERFETIKPFNRYNRRRGIWHSKQELTKTKLRSVYREASIWMRIPSIREQSKKTKVLVVLFVCFIA